MKTVIIPVILACTLLGGSAAPTDSETPSEKIAVNAPPVRDPATLRDVSVYDAFGYDDAERPFPSGPEHVQMTQEEARLVLPVPGRTVVESCRLLHQSNGTYIHPRTLQERSTYCERRGAGTNVR